MPAKLPRLNVTITQEQHSLLLELAALQDRSAASFLREMLDAATPMLAAMLPIYRAAAAQEAMQPEALQAAIRDALAGVETQRAQLDFLGLISGQETHLANDADAAPAPARSVATEDAGAVRPRRRKRA